MGSLKRKDAPENRPPQTAPVKSSSGEPPSKRAKSQSASNPKDKNKSKSTPQKDKVPSHQPAAPVISQLKEDETLFPRGGGSVLSPLEHKQIQLQAKKDVLFEQESSALARKGDQPTQKEKKTSKFKTATASAPAKDPDAVKVEGLNFKRLVKGSLVLGQISSVSPLELELSLPNNLVGHVPITAISEHITKKLESDAQESEDENEDENSDERDTEPTSLFSVGQYVRAYVVSTMDDAGPAAAKSKRRIELSLYPELANSGLAESDVVENCTVMGSIVSVEDHGYVVSLDIQDSTLRGFLPKKEVDPTISASSLVPGCVHLFVVSGKRASGTVARLSLLNANLGNLKLFPASAKTINTFLPGTAVEVLVSDVSSRGIVGKVMGHLDVTADIVHSGSGPSGIDLESTYKVGSKLKARIICNFPAANTLKLGISLLPHVTALKPKLASSDGADAHPLIVLPGSSTVEKCVVSKVEPGIGLYVDVGIKGVPGFVHISRVKDGKIDALYESSGPYKTGSTHKGRVVGYSAFDGMFLLSFEKSVLERQFLRIEDVPVGEIISVTVEKLVVREEGLSGLIVKVADGITGFVPEMHLADVRLHHPEKKFREGLKVKARVLSVDPTKRQLRLTLKKTLVNAEAKPVKDFDEVAVGQQVPGTIIKIKPIGAFVQFYGTLRGFMPISEMSEAYIRDPNEHFRIGQVVTVHVVEVDSAARRLIVSCKDPSAFGMEKRLALQKLRPGQLVSGKVTQKSEDEIFLELVDSSLKAVLRSAHVTDKSASKSQSALNKIRVGQTLEDLVVLEKDEGRRAVVLSLKPSLVQASKDGRLLATLGDAKVGSLAQGFVRNITATAVFVQFAGNLTALLPKSLMSGTMQQEESFGLRLHKPILVKVHSVDDKRLVVAMPDAEPQSKTDKARAASKPVTNAVDPNITSTDDITVGKVTKARIVSVKKTQLNVALGDNLQGRVDVSEVFDSWDEIQDPKDPLSKFSAKQIIDVRVIGVHDARNYRFLPFSHRTAHSVLELTAKPSSLRVQGGNYKPSSLEDVKPESIWLAFVNNNEGNCLWVNLSPAIRGRIRASEASDDSSLGKDLRQNFPIGSALRTRVVTVNPENGHLDLSARSARPNEHLTWNELEQDTVMHARVTKVNDRQVLIQISDFVSGPVHMVDLSDDYDQANPLKYSKNDIIRVAVVSIDRSNKKVRLSTRESRVLNSALPVKDREITSISQIEAGNVLRGFVKNVSDKGLFITLGGVDAFVRIADLSDAYLKEWKEHFQVDQLVKGRVVSVDAATGHVQMSLKASVVDDDYKPLPGFADFKKGQVVTGKVRKVAEFGAFILIDKSANVSGLCHRTEMADKSVKDATRLYKEGDSVKAVVLSADAAKRKIALGLKPSYFADADSGDDTDDDEEHAGAGIDSDSGEDSGSEDEDMEDADSVVLFTGADGYDSASSDEGEADDEDDAPMADAQESGALLQGLDAGGFDWSGGGLDEPADISDAEKTGTTDKKNKKRRKVDIEVDRTGDLDSKGPQAASDFERLLLGQPNSSSLWIAYMAFQMQVSELSKAREIAERAINTINVREETEKLNVWIAYLNLEVAYGTDETLNEVFKRACQYNEEQEVYERLASICIQSGKTEKADELFQTMLKKFGSKSPQVWLNYAHFLYNSGESAERARALLPRAMKSLDSHAHLALTSKFAALEFRCPGGEPERGRTLFEGLLATYPKRFDLWNQLLDLETSVAGGDATVVRDVFERGTKVKSLKPRQAKTWFQRWAKWEEANGDAKSREKVSAKAKEWASLAEARRADSGQANEE